jgi:hypothetical protein
VLPAKNHNFPASLDTPSFLTSLKFREPLPAVSIISVLLARKALTRLAAKAGYLLIFEPARISIISIS